MTERAAPSAIKRVAQRKHDRKYYGGPDKWVDSVHEAVSFDSLAMVYREFGDEPFKPGTCFLIRCKRACA